jgi:hypothetical protein
MTQASPIDFDKLCAPFEPHELEWRVLRSGVKAGQDGERVWAIVIPYVNANAIRRRLDLVLGPENWKVEFREWTAGQPGVVCALSFRATEGWVTKEDGSEQSTEKAGDDAPKVAVKGGFSSAFKRAAAVWGIGRYLYELDECFARIHNGGRFRGKAKRNKQDRDGVDYRWDPPELDAPPHTNGSHPAQPQREHPRAVPPAPVNAPAPRQEPEDVLMPVGDHKGQRLGDIETPVLEKAAEWCAMHPTKPGAPALEAAIAAVLKKRGVPALPF